MSALLTWLCLAMLALCIDLLMRWLALTLRRMQMPADEHASHWLGADEPYSVNEDVVDRTRRAGW